MQVYSQLFRAQLENKAGDYSAGTGMFWLNTSSSLFKFYDGSSVRTVVTTDNTQTLTNKTISGCTATNLISGAATVTLPTTTSTLSTLALTETLTNKTLTSPVINGVSGAMDFAAAANTSRLGLPVGTLAGITALNRLEGAVWYASDTDKLYKDDGTSLTEIGSGSGSAINYISNPDFESATTGWAAYADAAATSPVNGTGGSPTVTITRSTSSPLRGVANGLITKDASNRQGEGVSYDFTIASADKAKILNISFEYAVSANFAPGNSSDITVWIYDVTNSVLIPVSPYTIQGATGYTWKFTGQFQSASNSTSYRLIFHVATTSASAWTMQIDSVVVGPTVQIIGAPVSDWTAFTPTGAWSANTTYTGFWRRVGDTMEVDVLVSTSGAPTSASLTINAPTGYTIDTAKYASTVLGNATILDSGTATFSGLVTANNSSSVAVVYGDDAAGGVALAAVTQAAPMTFAASDAVRVRFIIPIVGWGSSVTMSSDTDTRVLAMRASGDPASASSGNPIIFPTADYDTHGAYNTSTGRYTVPLTGYYRIHGFIDSANSAVGIFAYVDAASVIKIGSTDSNGECSFTGTVRATASQIIDIRPNGTLDATNVSVLNIERLSGPATIAASESVIALYESNSSTSCSSAAATIINFEDLVFDSHSAVTVGASWKFTAPIAGKYRVTSNVEMAADSNWSQYEPFYLMLFKNGTSNRMMDSLMMQTTMASNYTAVVSGSAIVSLVVGDYVDVRVFQQAGPSIGTGTDAKNVWVSVERIGN